MKLRNFVLCMVVLALAIPTFAADSKSPMKPGKWQVTIATDMPNMPFKMPASNTTVCVTKEMAEKPEPPKTKKDDDCKISDYKLEGNVVTYSVACPKQSITGTGKFTYESESYTGEVKMNMGDSEITQKHSGKYAGECEK